MAHLRCDFRSDAMGMNTSMTVILPEKTDRSQVPVVYLLHGLEDNCTGWARYTSVERYAREKNAALVMPEVQRSFYADMDRGLPYFTFIHDELPEICRGFFGFSAKREKNYLMGLSMGGYGALKCGLLAPETFSAVASLSGGVDAVEIASNDAIKGNDGLFFDIFGPADKVKGSDNDLFAVAERLAKRPEMMPKVYMWCGTEDFLYQSNLRMRDHLRALGYDLTYEESPGDHQWKYWDTKIQTVLDWLPIKL